jgi:hypothetical protein
MGLNLKSGHLILWSYLRSVIGFVGGVGKSVRLFHAFHNGSVSTKLLLRDIV